MRDGITTDNWNQEFFNRFIKQEEEKEYIPWMTIIQEKKEE